MDIKVQFEDFKAEPTANYQWIIIPNDIIAIWYFVEQYSWYGERIFKLNQFMGTDNCISDAVGPNS